MKNDVARKFAEEWISAWNSHDLERILSHYEDGFEMSSSAIIRLTGEASGTLKGKQAVGFYWEKALKKYPELEFTLLHVLCGVNTVTVIYKGVLGLSAEVFHFSTSGKVSKAFAHYEC